MTLSSNPDSYALLSSVSDKGSSEGPLECSVPVERRGTLGVADA